MASEILKKSKKVPREVLTIVRPTDKTLEAICIRFAHSESSACALCDGPTQHQRQHRSPVSGCASRSHALHFSPVLSRIHESHSRKYSCVDPASKSVNLCGLPHLRHLTGSKPNGPIIVLPVCLHFTATPHPERRKSPQSSLSNRT